MTRVLLMTHMLLAFFLLTFAADAMAQTLSPSDSVTVTGAKDRLTVHRFVQTFTAPTRITGKIARWETPICPLTVGLRSTHARYISQRVREVAAKVGAPVNDKAGCKPNIEIVFTTAPQGLADTIRKKHDAYLGYTDTAAQRDALAKITRPIQSWYLTNTQDLAGKTVVDGSRLAGTGAIRIPCFEAARCQGGSQEIYSASPVHAMLTTGYRAIGDGLRAGFDHVIIVADPTKLLDHEMGTLADYIAMLSLTQLSSLDVCQNLASISGLLTPGCASSAQSLTANDLGYLRGLYHMNPERGLSQQEDQIAWQIRQGAADAGE
jgi:hypothetical protein